MKVIIVDDAAQARKLLRLMLSEISDEIEVIAEAANVMEAQLEIQKHQPDLIFLDIEMPGKSGLQFLEELDVNDITFETVFVTAYNQYAIQAFKLSAVDYLLKPFRKTELQEAVQKVSERRKQKKSTQQLDNLLDNLKTNESQKLCIPIDYGYEYLPLDEIEYLEAEGAYTMFYMLGKKNIMVSKNLKQFENILCILPNFSKINRSNIINLSFLTSYRKEDRGILVLKSGKTMKISPNYIDEFIEKINQFTV